MSGSQPIAHSVFVLFTEGFKVVMSSLGAVSAVEAFASHGRVEFVKSNGHGQWQVDLA